MTLHPALLPGLSRIHGAGVIAVQDIPLGTAVWAPCPRCRVLSPAEQATLPGSVLAWATEYGYRRADRGYIIPCRGAHLFNHSCEPSVLDLGLSVGIAVTDIRRGHEVCCDYRTFRYDDPWSFDCRCGSPGCVGVVRSNGPCLAAGLACEWRSKISVALEAAALLQQVIPVMAGDINGRDSGEERR